MILDYHMHMRDPDGQIEFTMKAVERYVETATARGIDEIGFTEHVYYFRQTQPIWSLPYQTERCAYDLDEYVDTVLEAKRQGLPVKLGLEVDYVGPLQDALSTALEPYPWDFLLGSVHWIDGLGVDQEPGVWAEHSVDEVWRLYFQAQKELASSGHVDVLAHPDVVKIFGRRPEQIEYPNLESVALEISTAGLHKPVGELYPDRGFLRALSLPITTASDAHSPVDVGRDFDRALELAHGEGFETVTVFEGRVPRQEPLG